MTEHGRPGVPRSAVTAARMTDGKRSQHTRGNPGRRSRRSLSVIGPSGTPWRLVLVVSHRPVSDTSTQGKRRTGDEDGAIPMGNLTNRPGLWQKTPTPVPCPTPSPFRHWRSSQRLDKTFAGCDKMGYGRELKQFGKVSLLAWGGFALFFAFISYAPQEVVGGVLFFGLAAVAFGVIGLLYWGMLSAAKTDREARESLDRQKEQWLREEERQAELQASRPAYRRTRLTNQVISEVFLRDEGKCVLCGSQEELQFDHIIPVSKGGSSEVDNIRILCAKCNTSRGNRI